MSSQAPAPAPGLSDEEMDRYDALARQAADGLSDDEMGEYDALARRASPSPSLPFPSDRPSSADRMLSERMETPPAFGRMARAANPNVAAPEPTALDIALGITTPPLPSEVGRDASGSMRPFDPAALPFWERMKYAGGQAFDTAMEGAALIDPISQWHKATTTPGSPLAGEIPAEIATRASEGVGELMSPITEFGRGAARNLGADEQTQERAALAAGLGAMVALPFGAKALGPMEAALAKRLPVRPIEPVAAPKTIPPIPLKTLGDLAKPRIRVKAKAVPVEEPPAALPETTVKPEPPKVTRQELEARAPEAPPQRLAVEPVAEPTPVKIAAMSPEKPAQIPPAAPPPEPPPAMPAPAQPGTPLDRIMSRVIRKSEQPKPSVGERVVKAFEGMHDYFEGKAPLGRFEKATAGELSKTGPRATAEALQGKAGYDVQRVWETGRFNGEQVFETPPMEMLRKVRDAGDMDSLSGYALARRQASKYAPNDMTMGFSPEDGAAVIADVEATKPHVKAAAEAVNRLYHMLWDESHDLGVIPEKTWESTKGEFYVPGARYFGPDQPPSLSKPRTALSPLRTKRVKGGEQLIKEPIEQTFDRLVRMRQINNEARVGRKIVEWHDIDPELAKPFVEEIKAGPEAKAKFDYDNLYEEAAAEIRGKHPAMPEADVAAMARDTAIDRLAEANTGENVVTNLPDGKKRVFKVHDRAFMDALATGGTDMAQAINGLVNTKVGKAFQWVTQMKRSGITLPPQFILRQATLYDPINTLLNDTGRLRSIPPRAVKATYDAVASALNEWTQRVVGRKGIVPETEIGKIFDDIGPMHMANLDAEARGGFTKPKPKTIGGKAARGAKKVYDATLDTFRLTGEAQQGMGRRFAARGLLEEWQRKGEWEPGQVLTPDQATDFANVALRSGGSFRLGGSTSSAINKVLAFWKASERIPVDAPWNFKRNPKAYTAKALALGVMPYVAEWLAFKDEDWYKDMPLYRRPGLTISQDVTLPVAHPVALLGLGLREMLRRASDGENSRGAEVFAKAFAEQMPSWAGAFSQAGVELATSGEPKRAMLAAAGNITPDLARGAFEAGTGTDFFTMRDINPIGSDELKQQAPELVTDERISPLLNGVSKWVFDSTGLKVTPLELDHLARSYGGTAAKWVTRSGVENPEAADEMLFGWAHRRVKESQEVSDFWDLYREFNGRQAAKRGYEKNADVEGVQRMLNAKTPKVFQTIIERIRANNDQMRDVPEDEKRRLAEETRMLARTGTVILKAIMLKQEPTPKPIQPVR